MFYPYVMPLTPMCVQLSCKVCVDSERKERKKNFGEKADFNVTITTTIVMDIT